MYGRSLVPRVTLHFQCIRSVPHCFALQGFGGQFGEADPRRLLKPFVRFFALYNNHGQRFNAFVGESTVAHIHRL